MATTILFAAIVLFALTLLFATLLGVAKEKLHVEEDPRIPAVNEVLPAANCGGCGFAGCSDFAKAVIEERAEVSGCPVGGTSTAEAVAKVLGVEVVKTLPYRPVIHCGARRQDKLGVVEYDGVESCVEANVVGVTQACVYGCLGFGDCVESCDYDALHMVDGKPEVDYVKCTGCGACVKACPRDLIERIPFKENRMLTVACANKEPGKSVKAVCKVGCIGCSLCQRLAADIFEVDNNLAHVNYDNYETEEKLPLKVLQKCPAEVMMYFGDPEPQYAKQLAKEKAEAEKKAKEAAEATSS